MKYQILIFIFAFAQFVSCEYDVEVEDPFLVDLEEFEYETEIDFVEDVDFDPVLEGEIEDEMDELGEFDNKINATGYNEDGRNAYYGNYLGGYAGPQCNRCPTCHCYEDRGLIEAYCCGCSRHRLPINCYTHRSNCYSMNQLCYHFEYMMKCCCRI